MKKFILITALHASLFTLHVTEAQIIHVPADQPTIQAGINAAVTGDTVLVADGTYLENINYNGKAIMVASHFLVDANTNHINNTIIDGSQPANPDYGSVVTFITAEDTTSVLCGFTITGGTGMVEPAYGARIGGGIVCYYSTAKIIHNKIEGNEVSSDTYAWGGGIACIRETGNSWMIVENNDIKENHSLNQNGTSTTNTITGGGMEIWGNARIINNVIENNFIDGGTAKAMGGGIFTQSTNSGYDTVFFMNNTIRDNVASSEYLAQGGGIFTYKNHVIMRDNLIRHDSLFGDETDGAGALLLESSYAEVHNNVFTNNIVNKINAYWGVGLFCAIPQGPVIITNNEFSFNIGEQTSTGTGGGISVADAFDQPILVEGNRFLYNKAYHGGGFYERSSYNVVLENNVFEGNETYRGGALGMYHYIQASGMYRPLVVNNTFDSNSASFEGGVLRYRGDFEAPVIFNCIFWGNAAPDGKDIKNYGADTLLVSYSDIDTAMIAGPWLGFENIFGDPGFIDDSCHISDTSACHNSGEGSIFYKGNWYYAPDNDFDGDERPGPYCNLFDIGADEIEFDCVGVDEFRIQNSKLKIDIFPNPTFGIVDFQLSTFNFQRVSLKIYDLHGRRVAMVLDKKLPVGEHVVRYDASGLPAGVYLVKGCASGVCGVSKLVVH